MAVRVPRLNVGSASLRDQVTPETMTLWLLVAIEVVAHVGLRRYYRRSHGG
jgi:hypothetical protein